MSKQVCVGCVSDEMPATKEVQDLCDKMKTMIQTKCGEKSFNTFKALRYRSQVVAGAIFYVKIQTKGDGVKKNCIHAKIFEALKEEDNSVMSVEMDKTVDGPIDTD